ncbi:MAG: alpha/beta hydrolase [Nanoarchaeota archaeon]
MKNCIIIHGCAEEKNDKTYSKQWIQWTKKQLMLNEIKTETPLMPKPWKPVYENYKKEFEKYEVNENTTLIGHSCGCAFLVRWLGDNKIRIKKLILVAPWKIASEENDYIRKEFYEYKIDNTINSRVKDIVMFTADDEEEDGKKSLIMFHKILGGKIIELKNRGHYTLGDMKTEEFPELIKEVLK